MANDKNRFQEIIRETIAKHGKEVICDVRFLNILNDLHAFAEIPAAKFILRSMLKSGYGEKLLALDNSPESREMKMRAYSSEIAANYGFQADIIDDVFSALSYGLGWPVTQAVVAEVAPVVTTPSPTSTQSSDAVKELFPIFGITLGQTTWEQAENEGYHVKLHKDGLGRYINVQRLVFGDHEGIGKFTSAYLWLIDDDFPSAWKAKGFSWDNSYDAWIAVFKNFGFYIDVKKQPTIEGMGILGQFTLSAEFYALTADGMLEFRLSFDHGENGYQTSSPKTLFKMSIHYKGS